MQCLPKTETHFENMERLELDIPALVPQEIHHRLEIVLVRNVPGHDRIVGAVEEDLSEEFKGLALGHVVRR